MTTPTHTASLRYDTGDTLDTVVFSDGYTITTVHNYWGYEVFSVEGYMKDTDQYADIVCRHRDEIEERYFQDTKGTK